MKSKLFMRRVLILLLVLTLGITACSSNNEAPVEKPAVKTDPKKPESKRESKLPAVEVVQKNVPPDWSKSSVMYEVNVRQFTKEGTFKAFQEHLPRLKELGVDILWFMPIHPISKEKRIGSLGSYYSVGDYVDVNPEFGTKEDFKALVDEAHAMGFKVVLDWVANHTGWDHPWTANKDWYTTNAAGEIVHPPGTNWQDVADLNFNNEDMQAAMIDAMKYWVTEFDVDGFRADYAGGAPLPFWEKARAELDQLKPLYMLAEDERYPQLLQKAFHSNYGWDFHKMLNQAAKGLQKAEQIIAYAEGLSNRYPEGTYPLQFTSNHDENSWSGTEYERMGDAVKTMAALSFTVPGMPLIYSGQEAGLRKRLQFFDKDEIPWDDLSMQTFYQELIRLKKENPALWNGSAGGTFAGFETDQPRLLAFERKKDDRSVIVVMNLSKDKLSGTIQFGNSAGSYTTYNTQEKVDLAAAQQVELAPWEFQIYSK